VVATRSCQHRHQTGPYPVAAPLDQYLIPDQASEIVLARSAAPASISDGAEVLVLGRDGYTTAVRAEMALVCLVERSLGKSRMMRSSGIQKSGRLTA